MRFFRILSLSAAALCLAAQSQEPKPGAQTGPSVIGPEGVTLPLTIVPPPVIPADRVVIQVGETRLTAGQLDQILGTYTDSQRVAANGPGRTQFVDQVVRVLLLAEEGRLRKLDQTEIYKNQLNYFASLILSAQADEGVRRQVRGDEALLKAYYEAHKQEYMQIHARHILIRMQGSPLSVAPGEKDLSDAEALAKAQELRRKIVAGADFAAIAQVDSNDMGSSAKGGDLGFVKRGQTLPSFEEALFQMQDGELSEPVKTAYGYHLIKVEERKPTRTFEDLRPELQKAVEDEAIRKFLTERKAKTKIVLDPEFNKSTESVIGIKP